MRGFHTVLFTIFLVLPALLQAKTNGIPVRTVAELVRLAVDNRQPDVFFDLEATVCWRLPKENGLFSVEDETGAIALRSHKKWIKELDFRAGDRVRVSGYTYLKSNTILSLRACKLKILSRGLPPAPVFATARDIRNGKHRFRPVRLRGQIRDIVADDVDQNCFYFSIKSPDGIVYAGTRTKSLSRETLISLIGSDIEISGLCLNNTSNPIARQLIGYYIEFQYESDILILSPSPEDPFDKPEINRIRDLSPEFIAALDRHRTRGDVIAVWDRNHLLIRSDQTLHRVDLFNQEPPDIGQQIEVVGFPGTDLYTINLSRAIWRPTDKQNLPIDSPTPTPVDQLFQNTPGGKVFSYNSHGKAIQLTGVVRSLPAPGTNRLFIECSKIVIPIVIDALKDNQDAIEIGSEVSVSGIWILQTSNWKLNAIFPTIEHAFLVTRQPNDLIVIRHPPWWTPVKLTVVIVIMVLIIVTILIWNRSLQILANRKSRELFKAQIKETESELRIDERTRLAAELHDYTAQNLTAISYQIAAAEDARLTDSTASDRYLRNAGKMIKSTLTDLRRCLWDLKNDTLSNPDFNEAISETVLPVSGEATIKIRFNVRRSRISDKVAHAILSICRELVSNAVCHGNAQKIRIAGEIRSDELRFMVHDNGSGFDTTKQKKTIGHFGLDGIAERVKRLEGTLSIRSVPGAGTKVLVTIPKIPIQI